ncbi:VOC family protein [Microlunatus sp. GCM10028923]|uniref:VOC family protein n=1 Tax=Microlunatus sp. GCM10028923 TaxID=3273400 RepID=UPI003623AD14
MTSVAEGPPTDRLIFINLPVADLARSRAFYAGLGFGVDPRFSDDRSACVVVSPRICVMLLVRDRFAEFVVGEVADPGRTTQVLNCLSATCRDEVDRIAVRAVTGGGRPWRDKVDQDGVYGRSFADPDGHVWELLHLSCD